MLVVLVADLHQCRVCRKRQQEEREAKQRAEEEEMERRRQELLSEKDGYWSQRMAQVQKEQGLAGMADEDSSTDEKVGAA